MTPHPQPPLQCITIRVYSNVLRLERGLLSLFSTAFGYLIFTERNERYETNIPSVFSLPLWLKDFNLEGCNK